MNKGLLDYLTDHLESGADQKSTIETTSLSGDTLDRSLDLIEPEDQTFITSICGSYIDSYESGELTFDKTVKLAWTFLDDYEPFTEDSNAFYTYKSEILYELLEHLVTLKPAKAVTKRTRVGTPPPKLRRRIAWIVDELCKRNKGLRKLPVDTDITDSFSSNSINRNAFEAVAERFQKWGFPNTTAKMVYDIYYDKSSKSLTSVKSS